MFNKILIANRGEIACRVIRTAQRLGISTVAVYSDADRDALHVTMADEAVHIGAAPSRESYLLGDKVIEAALRTGAQAIHPGYGFLSENADFCNRCKQEKLVFIGPPVGAIEAMGSKSAAKQIMEKAGVPLVPGYHGDDQSPALLKQASDEMGYPVLLKATAGGGGKGMRQVWSADEFDEALAAAKRESLNAFGDDRMLVEKYLTQPRHVEIQVFCDQQGNAVYLFERDCSVQRRHQKVIEEAPAPGMHEALRQQMGEAAIRAAQAIDYEGAGTVEFLLDSDGSFYFMEMNTRLQVEHPVTEMITGQDLVEWQLRVASGEPLPLQQQELRIHGHAFEARVYAEDPDNDFLPVTGTLSFLQPPVNSQHVRVDSGVRQGDEVSVFYDPMIAKLIVWDEDRDRALSRLTRALGEYRISGMTTNLEFLYNLANCQPFRDADLDTGFIDKHHAAIFLDGEERLGQDLPLAALYLVLRQQQSAEQSAGHSRDPSSPWHNTDGWRLNAPSQQDFTLLLHEQAYPLTVEQRRSGAGCGYRITGSDATYCSDARGVLEGNQLRANLDGYQLNATVSEHDGIISLYTANNAISFRLQKPDLGDQDSDQNAGGLSAPMNGTIVTLLVEPGSEVAKGDALLVMEAMKMEHSIRAPADGRVVSFFYNSGDLVDGGSELVEFETNPA
ncbi:acetyl/propionyl/methylcrotonyl-CoA carboxylase subunit alpha [Aestuariirhabdus sp. Z084]|uniref:acetyl/propionyl/methylcrotonyl-CoA carboxylase subunit alpha n=1 Tax=Aestuariirhabdus haliotis TaxID=2918751 RepID=UPI00201B435E|nr:acetyl/propionyl/methylcrotonyl-CoA carboxylase subunit alpha [Aestuariirhabdus haliotis]MCL6415279.1 acetyl/propionyl/methylcrotonyl-CoA carboxylase subunit alpha [Aestuariirhabdus haliotis]MCL6419539.1 acetyl/propionyl/methylcrotonyl-CoA carboxylase subunit alpha [Aestuariirhabdus haliotis]